jgi:hypothetical protein
MARRLTASDKWQDPWFFELTPLFKCLWLFLVDNCNHAGIWAVNKRQAEFFIGGTERIEIDWQSVLKVYQERIFSFSVGGEERWFIPKFLKFQYPYGLSYDNKAHKSVILILKEYNLLGKSDVWGFKGAIRVPKGLLSPKQGAKMGLTNPCHTAKDKDKDKDKDILHIQYMDVFAELWAQYPKKLDKGMALKHFTTSVINDKDVADIRKALAHYLQYIEEEIREDRYIKHAKTWFNNWRDWIEWKSAKPPRKVL